MERGEEREGRFYVFKLKWKLLFFFNSCNLFWSCHVQIQYAVVVIPLVFLVLYFSLGCGIGYGYLHRIPTRPAQPNTENKHVLQSAVIGSSEELVASDHTEVQVITSFFYLMLMVETFVEFISESETQVLCSQVPSAAACSPSSVSEIDLNQMEGAVQDLSVTSPTQPAVDFGNRI